MILNPFCLGHPLNRTDSFIWRSGTNRSQLYYDIMRRKSTWSTVDSSELAIDAEIWRFLCSYADESAVNLSVILVTTNSSDTTAMTAMTSNIQERVTMIWKVCLSNIDYLQLISTSTTVKSFFRCVCTRWGRMTHIRSIPGHQWFWP